MAWASAYPFYTCEVFVRLRHRLRVSRERHERAKDDAAVERFLRERDESEHEQAKPVELPPARSNTDWAYVSPP
jgi:hypothetical protein